MRGAWRRIVRRQDHRQTMATTADGARARGAGWRWTTSRRSWATDAARRPRTSSDDGDVVIVGIMAAASVESVVLGMAVTATAFMVMSTMMVMAGAMTSS